MAIVLTNKQSESLFFDALCNCVGTGYIGAHGIALIYDKNEYDKAKAELTAKATEAVCYEAILMQVLRNGGTMYLEDVENNGAENSNPIHLTDVHNRVKKAPLIALNRCLMERGDASDYDSILQYVFYKEVIFG